MTARTRIALLLALVFASACKREQEPSEDAAEPQPCRESAIREGTTACGLDGALEQVCTAGAWVDTDECIEPWLMMRDQPDLMINQDTRAAPIALWGETLVVSGDRLTGNGDLLVFVREELIWKQQATIEIPGVKDVYPSLALHGDRLAVTGKDSVFVFERSGGAWQQRDALSFSSESMGRSLALSNDTLVIGSANADYRVTVLVRREGSWREQAKLEPVDAREHHVTFGDDVALDRDTVLIGYKWDSERDLLAGSAMVFERRGETWELQAKLIGSNTVREDQFGSAFALSGDTAVIAAEPGHAPGYAYVFERRGSEWTESARLAALEPKRGDKFGRSVAIHGDTLIFGAPGDYGDVPPCVYLFFRHEGRWSEPIHKVPVMGAGSDVALADGLIAVAGYKSTVVHDPRASNPVASP